VDVHVGGQDRNPLKVRRSAVAVELRPLRKTGSRRGAHGDPARHPRPRWSSGWTTLGTTGPPPSTSPGTAAAAWPRPPLRGISTVYRWDGAGRLVALQQGSLPPTRYAFDPRGLLAEVIDPTGSRTVLDYNDRGALTAAVDPAGGRWSLELDRNDRLVGATDPLGRLTTYTLDPSGRVAAMTTADGVEYRYERDPDGMIDTVLAAGRSALSFTRDFARQALEVRDEAGRASRLHFDVLDRIVSYEAPGVTTKWVYDDDEPSVRVTSTGLPPTLVHLDPDGLAQAVETEGLDPVTLRRDSEGRLVRLSCEGLERRWERDRAGAVVDYREILHGRERRTLVQRDGDGRAVAEIVDGERHGFAYDDAGLIILLPEAGIPMLIGGLAGGGGTIVSAEIWNHGHIDWGEVIMNTALGAASGGAGAGVSGAAGELPQAARMVINTGFGAADGAAITAADSAATNRPSPSRVSSSGPAAEPCPA